MFENLSVSDQFELTTPAGCFSKAVETYFLIYSVSSFRKQISR